MRMKGQVPLPPSSPNPSAVFGECSAVACTVEPNAMPIHNILPV